MNATMVSIHSKEENDFVESITEHNQSYKLGAIILARNIKAFVWLDGTPFVYANWAKGQPYLENRLCVGISIINGKWYETTCGAARQMCQISLRSEDASFVNNFASQAIHGITKNQIKFAKNFNKIDEKLIELKKLFENYREKVKNGKTGTESTALNGRIKKLMQTSFTFEGIKNLTSFLNLVKQRNNNQYLQLDKKLNIKTKQFTFGFIMLSIPIQYPPYNGNPSVLNTQDKVSNNEGSRTNFTSTVKPEPREDGSQKSFCSCGVANVKRVVGGKAVVAYKHPWMARLTITSLDEQGYRRSTHCGGFIINNLYVLTAAHCVNERIINVKVALGSRDIVNGKMETIDVENIFIHEEYSRTYSINDIALLKLSHPVAFSNKIRPICLPPHRMGGDYSRLLLVGWGATNMEITSYPALLQEAVSREFPLEICKRKWKMANVYVWEKQLCGAGDGIAYTRAGDSGSSIIYESQLSGRSYAVGIVSYGPKYDNFPSVYTRVSAYLDWISKRTVYCNGKILIS
ncbi:transmembrane protease serine 9-like protein [Dinothrombium tinctorium]|uniref:Transmembrane protease serine 9-like protein n=1 Tax=Dinothrombium tinctorium TaxID=1965070 RepID=A0A3S4QXJ6_9ACAR|nr:transmembrane protease serine 9-like protein [Dinothrombium tinctorium]